MNTITSLYTQASRRLFLMDYDGTLVPLAPTPEQAVPTPEILELLGALAADPKNTVVIISGRDHQTLDKWLGHLPVAFAAEHGFAFKLPKGDWAPMIKIKDGWKDAVHQQLQAAVEAVPGSFIEEKDSALCWHYRTAADAILADQTLEHLRVALPALSDALNLRVIYGSKVVEVQPAGMDKGLAANFWLSQGDWDFILAAGDDTTDEDLLKACPPDAHTIHIGSDATAARTQLADVQSFTDLLRDCLKD